MQMVERAWLVFDLTAYAMALGSTMTSLCGSVVLFSFVGSPLPDRFFKRTLLMLSHYVNVMSALIVATIVFQKAVIPALVGGNI